MLLVLGQTPKFHSTKPGKRGSYGAGAASMPREAAWKNYVSTVVRRYKGQGVDYQVWNEGNVSGYWQGTPAQMAKLTQLTSKIVNSNDSGAKVGRTGSRDAALEPAAVAAHVLRAAHRRARRWRRTSTRCR